MLNWIKILFALSLFIFVGCEKSSLLDNQETLQGQTFTLYVKAFSDEVVSSSRAAANDVVIDRGFIFFYDNASGIYKGYESLEDKTITQDGTTVKFDVGSDFSISDKVIAVFNHDTSCVLPDDFSVITSDNLNDYFPISREYLEKIQEDMNSGDYSLGMPMSLNDFVDTDRAVREVYRSVARMELFIKEGLTIEHDSHTHSIGVENLEYFIVNEVSVGSMGFSSLSPAVAGVQQTESCFDVAAFDYDFPYSLTEYSSTSSLSDTPNKIYLQEFPYASKTIEGGDLYSNVFDENRFAIILKHDDTNIYTETPSSESRYYKLNLLDKATSTYFDVVRNHSYRVIITAVNSRGYETLEEAYQMPPSNIEYEIYDDQGGLTYSNGQYAISLDEILSFDEILVYGTNQTTLEFNNIRYVLPDGGQMDGAEFETNEVYFSVLSDSEGLITSTSSDFEFDGEGMSYLTDKGQSISVTLEGEGECTIALRIKLGNLEMGRDEITIKKVATNGDGDGAFDAHPGQLYLDSGEYVEGSWQSDDIDFGARASSASYDEDDGGVVIYFGENATPTGYRTMDGYVSGQNSVNSYPVFSPKTRKGYYSYKRASDGETLKVMIQIEQLAPFYLGHFGSASSSSSSVYHYNGLICEKIEEIPEYDWSGVQISQNNGVMMWSESQQKYYTETIYGDYLGIGDRYLNLVEGLDITKNIVENNTQEGSLPLAARYCYMKNDVNGNGVIDDDEPIVWFLPTQNQLLAMWVNMNVFSSDLDIYKLNNDIYGDANVYYWSCSEIDDQDGWRVPSVFNSHVLAFNMLEGQSDYYQKDAGYTSGQCHVRCVRGLDY
ncbi:MAG: hypothetical protein R3Y61_07215 [Rikenellaceae bacterium]